MTGEAGFDVIVIGGGHAGCEAAFVSARMGMKTALVTIKKERIAEMSCNPAIGGLAKGQVVREIDALGGEMAKASDATCIQFKVLNPSKGPAVRGLRAQADKKEYRFYMIKALENTPNLEIIEAMADEILADDRGVTGIVADNKMYKAKAVIVTTGTFLKGLIHIGLESFPGGRRDDPPSDRLSDSLKKLGFELGRMKTGTPPRVDRDSLDFSKFILQPGDETITPFSFSTEKIEIEQVPCHLVYTNEETNKVIRDNLEYSPLYSSKNKKIFSLGPRYCPSIEDKVVKFPEKKSHQVFIEPEERNSNEMYLNGISTSLPVDVQEKYLKTIKGFENIKILKPAYGIEYDFAPPSQLSVTLETKNIPNLFFAGQINGTSGYEEAAGQGLIAGINAVHKIKGKEPFITGRDKSYIGVMIDDIITLGVTEPYRLFSSRAEHRLVLRNDNADIRLSEKAYKAGLLDKKTYDMVMRKKEFFKNETTRLKKTHIKPSPSVNKKLASLGEPEIENETDLLKFLKRPGITYKTLSVFTEIKEDVPSHFIEFLDAEVSYAGYIKKQAEEIEKFKKLEQKLIPKDFDYLKQKGLSLEAQQKLDKIRPRTIGQAGRIDGVTPSDINVLLILLKKHSK